MDLRGTLITLGVTFLGAMGFVPVASAQQFVRNTTTVPLNAGDGTENVDFADIDNDGDWDAAFANGGDLAQIQNAIWINQGFLQAGTVGAYVDGTAARAPAILDQSRDIEFVDFDSDGDLDVYVSNTAQMVSQGNRWWANMGGLQGGSAGFYQEETSTRFVGLGGAGSSIAPSQVLGSGNFIDFSCDSDFGDLDNDGDIDLFHASYGLSISGTGPTRCFVNDGLGHFSEFNPSGFQLAGQPILAGNPGLWCEGTQLSNTTNTTGANCDIAASTLGIEIGDIDGDLDLDMLMGARNEVPRMFVNRITDNGFFRDATGSAYPPGYSTGGGHYEQELGDFDGDGDLDIYGLNWLNLIDATLVNTGPGVFNGPTAMPGSSSDDNESDFFDYDCDGDLDVLVANWSGQERIYTNNGLGGMTLAAGLLPSDPTETLDCDACDIDNDGDYDFIAANSHINFGQNEQEWVLVNGTANNDVTPPSLYRLEQAVDRPAGPAPTVVRVQVYDSAPYYINWYDTTYLEVTVDAGPVTQYPMQPSMGQIFRGEIPGNLVGLISYRAVSIDKYGNTGLTAFKTYNGTPGAAFCTNASLGGDHTTACPCGNTGAPGNGCAHSFDANGANLAANGSIAADTVQLIASNEPSTAFTLFMQHNAAGDAVFHDGVLCAGGTLTRLRGRAAVSGAASFPNPLWDSSITLSQRGSVTIGSGAVRYYGAWYRNASTTFCPPATANVSNGWKITW